MTEDIPKTITPEMKAELKAIGFTDEMIATLSPAQAWMYLRRPGKVYLIRPEDA